MIQGLFIGVNQYQLPITRLSCARADALALSSLASDSWPGSVATLLDGEATKANIITALQDLQQAGEDDFVIITFSGHGTEDHRLVPVDVDVSDVEGSCIGVDDLAVLLDQIPAKQLLVVLDCCFSGGFGGARVFAPASVRSLTEDRSSIQALARGSGRIVITASGAGEPALETADFGHGVLSYYLVEGLQGPESLASDGRISLLALFEYVMERTVEAAQRMSFIQTPTLYGSVEGAPTLSVLIPGTAYAAAFPDRVRPSATPDWSSLGPYGFPPDVLASWSSAMPSLNELQLEAINKYGVLDSQSVLVVAPTGAGKTMIGELAAMRAVADGSRAVLLLPLKALANDKYDYMSRTYGASVKTVRATGDNSDQVGDIFSGQYDVALLTYEKFKSLMLGNPHIMRGLSVVVVDEVQTIGDPARGPDLELLLTLLRAGHGRQTPPQIVALSAVIGDTRGFERWLGGGLLRHLDRPVPLRESVIDASGGSRHKEPDGAETYDQRFIAPMYVGGSQSNKPWVIPLVQRLVHEDKKVIVFRSTRGDTVGAARYLANTLGLPPATDALQLLPGGDRSSSSEVLRLVLQRGVAFHNSDLDREERFALESTFRNPDSPLRVIVATTTLAMGVNTPAEAIVIAGLRHPGGNPYTVAEYKNMAGRAGRLGHAEAGEAYIIATSEVGPGVAWTSYVNGQAEAISSHFLASGTDPQTLVLSCLVALGSSVQEEDLVELLENSFAMWLRKEAGLDGWNQQALRSDLGALVNAGLVDREPGGALTLTALGRYAGESGLEVRSVTLVASALRFAPPVLGTADAVALAQVTCELDHLYMPANRRSRQEQQRWPLTLPQLGVSPGLLNGLHVGGGDPFGRMKRAVACLLFMSNRSMAEIEGILMQHTRDGAAAGPIRQVASRTRDVIDAVIRIAIFNGRTISDELDDGGVTMQLEFGLPTELVELAHAIGTTLNRGEYLALQAGGITDPAHLAGVTHEHLTSLIGMTAADRVHARLLDES